MPKKIDWLYSRKSCVTCQRAKDYRGAAVVKVAEEVDARTTRIGPTEALALLKEKGITKVVATKLTSIVTFDLKKNPPDDETLLGKIIGPTGNLRAPSAVVGKTLLVGFNEETYAEILGA